MGVPLADALRDARFDGDIEIVGLDAAATRSIYTFGSHGVGWSRYLDPDERARLQALIHALPVAQSARCHMPAFGLVFTQPREFNVTLCFQCNNAYVNDTLAVFDPRSHPAQQLLTFLRSYVPNGWTTNE